MVKPEVAQRNRIARALIQLVFFVLAPGLFSAAFNGVKYIFAQVGAVSAIEVTSFVSLLVALCLFTVLFGRFFCGYACAFGFLGDVLFALAAPVRRRLKLKPRLVTGKVEVVARFAKYVILIAFCVLGYFQLTSAVTPFDPWVAFASLTSLQFASISAAGLVVLIVLALFMALQERAFCEFLCPLGALFAILPHIPLTQFLRISHNCPKTCGRCQKKCPVGIFPDANTLESGECIACGRCADGCPLTNIGIARLETAAPAAQNSEGVTGARKKVKPAKVLGNELVIVVLKAAALLVVCYLLSQLRFIS
jgi:polyferredoxin